MTTVANTTGEAVVQYFSGQTDVPPASCDSYFRMENDNSRLAGVCQKWGWGASWGLGLDQERLYSHPAWVYGLYLYITANRSLGFIRRSLNKFPENIKEQAYLALVRPQLEYGCFA